MINLDLAPSRLRAMWETTIDLALRQPTGWTLIGAQMVVLHGLEHSQFPPRVSEDADVLVDIRAMQDGTERLSRTLMTAGFDLDGTSPTG